jgi:hypothetical protein
LPIKRQLAFFGTFESIPRMMSWPESKIVQAIIAFIVALLSAGLVASKIVMESFNNFYFGPHKAYPYPYSTIRDARIAMLASCGLAFFGAFIAIYLVMRLFSNRHSAKKQNSETR